MSNVGRHQFWEAGLAAVLALLLAGALLYWLTRPRGHLDFVFRLEHGGDSPKLILVEVEDPQGRSVRHEFTWRGEHATVLRITPSDLTRRPR